MVTLVWGVPQDTTPSYGTVQGYTEDHKSEESLLKNNVGQTVAVVKYDKKVGVTFSIVASSPVSKPDVGQLIDITGGEFEARKKVVCDNCNLAWENEGMCQLDINGTMYPAVQTEGMAKSSQQQQKKPEDPPPQQS